MPAEDFPTIIQQLRAVLAPYEPELRVLTDTPAEYTLVTKRPDPKKKRDVWFGGVKQNRATVSYHLMAVYIQPEIMAAMSPELRRRMPGKSCFNFSKPLDAGMQAELAGLTKACLGWYRREGML